MYSTYLWSRNDIAVLCLIAKARHESTVLRILAGTLVGPHLSIIINLFLMFIIMMTLVEFLLEGENLKYEY